jgi:hypothetical protein
MDNKLYSFVTVRLSRPKYHMLRQVALEKIVQSQCRENVSVSQLIREALDFRYPTLKSVEEENSKQEEKKHE